MAGHMAYIGGYTLPTLWGEGIQALGVKIFFLIGGFLIAKSWESDSNPVRYMTKRVFRIFPALIAFTLVAAYVIGPILSTLTINEYFQSPLLEIICEIYCYFQHIHCQECLKQIHIPMQ